ncbi:MAG: hypothetical protein Ct9H300mP11_29230 [Chloroflexota bacterium]|nr:MAG: hypothetical protein Ct9H300mP11_29230 [Chloroflexota bacterium]
MGVRERLGGKISAPEILIEIIKFRQGKYVVQISKWFQRRGGRNGCARPTWSITIEVLGFRRARSPINPSLPEHITLIGMPALAPPGSIAFSPLRRLHIL